MRRLLSDARNLNQQSKRQTRKFYREDDEKKKMEAWEKSVGLLREAQNKLDRASRIDRWTRHETDIEDMKQAVQQELHNIMKDKPLFLGE